MQESSIKTSPKQRIFIFLIAVIMLGSLVAVYAAIIMSGGTTSTTTSSIDDDKVTELQEAYESKTNEVETAAASYSDQYFAEFSSYKSYVTSFNSTSAEEGGLVTEDLKIGTGTELADGDTNYLAYYIGFCSDETIFDSSLDSTDDPTSLSAPLSGATSFIEGWTDGVVGMKLGGVRLITIPSDLAYGDTDTACGTNQPIKFIVMAIETSEPLATLLSEQTEAYNRYYYYAYYGIDYDEYIEALTESVSTDESTDESTDDSTSEDTTE